MQRGESQPTAEVVATESGGIGPRQRRWRPRRGEGGRQVGRNDISTGRLWFNLSAGRLWFNISAGRLWFKSVAAAHSSDALASKPSRGPSITRDAPGRSTPDRSG